jgi:cytochrome c biogenesis protein CcdA
VAQRREAKETIDEAELAGGGRLSSMALDPSGGLASALLLALLLGLRHATDPDHLAALATLTADPDRRGSRAAASLGLFWGVGHALSCFALGMGVAWVGGSLPPLVRTVTEVAVGLLIVLLSVRLLLRWRRGRLHAHRHRHGGVEHSHAHYHEVEPEEPLHAEKSHVHAHAERLGRTPLEALGIGCLHGVGGSALAVSLLAAGGGDMAWATALLASFSIGSIVAMGVASGMLGLVFERAPSRLALERATPALGMATFSVGTWYTFVAVSQLMLAT